MRWSVVAAFVAVGTAALHYLVAPGSDDMEALRRLQAAAPDGVLGDQFAVVVAGAWRAPPHSQVGSPWTHFWVARQSLASASQQETFTRAFRLRLDRAVEAALRLGIPRIVVTGGLDDALVSRSYILRHHAVPPPSAGSATSTEPGPATPLRFVSSASALDAAELANETDAVVAVSALLRDPSEPSRQRVVELLVETSSRTTEENADNAVALLRSLSMGTRVAARVPHLVVVSTPGHLRRCRMYFRRAVAAAANTSSQVYAVGSARETHEWRRPRGWMVPSSDLTTEMYTQCRLHRLLRAFLWMGVPDWLVCAAKRSWDHHAVRIGPALMSVPWLFELREAFAVAANIAHGKLAVAEVLDELTRAPSGT